MGFYSYTCAKTNLPIMASVSWGDEYAKVVVLGESGSFFKGVYDGYGRVLTPDGTEVEMEDSKILSGRLKLVLLKFYENERFEELGKSHSDPGQGHFHDEDLVDEWYSKRGFATWKEYRDAYFKKRTD
jgi:hypothetical protein